jgi:hypothetical protein
MSSMPSNAPAQAMHWSQRPSRAPDRTEGGLNFLGPSTGLLVGGAVVAGLAYLAWRYVGPDLVRYMKISRM